MPAPRPAFPYELRRAYDASYEPVVARQTMFVPSMVSDSVTALDAETGEERWRFFAESPVRFAPTVGNDKVYFVSDDGYLYCLNAGHGALLWKFRGLPAGKSDRKVIGHGRMVSLWPARGGPVLFDGVVYFAAGLWPSEGVYVHAVDAESGEAVWSNSEGDNIPASNWDHGVGQYSGLTPQGYLAIIGGNLVVPCGAQLPALLDLKTGQLQKYTMGWGGRQGLPKGCWFVAGVGKYLSHGGDLYEVTRPSQEQLPNTKAGQSDYKPWLYPGGWARLDIERSNQRELDQFRQPVMTSDIIYESDQAVVARDLTAYTMHEWTKDNIPPHRTRDEVPDSFGATFGQIWELASQLKVHLKAGSRLYLGGPDVVEAVDVSGVELKVVWNHQIEGTPSRMLVAAGKLFVVTTEGSILALGAPRPEAAVRHDANVTSPSQADTWTSTTKALLDATGARSGYALVLGVDAGRLIEELVRQSDLHVVAVDDDAARRWHKYPGRVQVRVAGGRVVLFEQDMLQATDVYTGRVLWETEVAFGKKPSTSAAARDAVRYARHRQWGPGATLPTTSELVVVDDAIYLSAGPSCLIFDPATGQTAGQIDLPQPLDKPWANLRVVGDYLVGSSGNHILWTARHSGTLHWRAAVARRELSLAVGGGKVFCAELADPRRGEDPASVGNTFALDLATGERVWQRTSGARIRYSPALDIVVTPAGTYRGSDGEPQTPFFNTPASGLAIAGSGLPEPAFPGYIAGNRLLTGNEQNLQVYDLLSGKQIGDSLSWVRRGCAGTRASTHLLTTRYRANSARIDLDSREITPLLGVRPGCSVNNNLYPADGVLKIPNLTAGCTCNYAPVSVACVPGAAAERGDDK